MYKFKEDYMKVPCFVWAEKGSIEQSAIDQIKNASSLSFAYHHTVLCPDAHLGYGAPIGGVLAAKDVIIPNFVGVDIGCGMCAVKTTLTEINTDTLKKVMGEIRQVIPVGFKKHKKITKTLEMATPCIPGNMYDNSIVEKEEDNTFLSIGTLGGGNHFLEIQKGSDGHIWVMLHSGSRNLGFKVAKHYNDKAIEWNDKYYSSVSKEMELAFLPVETWLGENYIKEMNYCVDFALANRKLMMNRVLETIDDIVKGGIKYPSKKERFNIAHNYAAQENHFGQNVWVHRKGATLAREGIIGIIPGSQGTKSYIVKGLGNPESFTSCSHGAGRVMGRKQAKKSLDFDLVVKNLNDKGIIHSVRKLDDLDEAPEAYKDIETVMDNQKDLVEVLVELTPLAVIKG